MDGLKPSFALVEGETIEVRPSDVIMYDSLDGSFIIKFDKFMAHSVGSRYSYFKAISM